MNKCLLFSGTSNLPLAKGLADKLKINLGKIEIIRFPDSESRVRIEENLKGKTVYLLQSLSSPVDEHLFELCLMADSAKRLGAKKIIALIPWLGYSKQDKEFRIGEAVSVEVIGKILSNIGLSKIIVFDLHSEKIKSYFKIPVVELSAKETLYEALKKDLSSRLRSPSATCARTINKDSSSNEERSDESRNYHDLVVISPDKGGKSRSEKFAHDYKLPIAYLQKNRDLKTGKISYQSSVISSEIPLRQTADRDDAIKGKICVIFDDIINRGGTVIKAAEMLKKAKAKRVIVLVTHGVLASGASENLQKSKVDEIYLTDTIEIPKEKQFLKLKITSVVNLLLKLLK